ncbi:MAG: hypothetical protein OXM54_09395 [Acidimicrobiaceae bacterium]|nr:hypothetical protein [Acidimicrobiaceae bacterium]
MADGAPSGSPGSSTVLSLILNEQRALRDTQDAQLRALLRLAGGILTVFLTTGTIAVAVSGELSAATGAIVFAIALILGTVLVPIEGATHRWKGGPDIEDLVQRFHHGGRSGPELELALVVLAREDYETNDRILRRVRVLAALQALVAFGGISALLGGLLAIA